jgi:hypothetical protein
VLEGKGTPDGKKEVYVFSGVALSGVPLSIMQRLSGDGAV